MYEIERLSREERKELWKRICDSTRSQMSDINKVFEHEYPEYRFVKVDRIQYMLSWDNTEIKYSFTIVGKNRSTGENESLELNTVCEIGDVRLAAEV
jgi:hypothetical protein